MDVIRRLVPGAQQKGGKRELRRVPAPDGEVPRLRGRDARAAEALEQLRAGVPLNWGQIEDDPELATLARLQEAGDQARMMPLREPDLEFKAALTERLSKRLPAPKEVSAPPVKRQSMAGFSERVQVLTQVEDNVSLMTDWRKVILRGVAVVAVVALAVWGLSTFISAATTPTFAWIELRRSGETISRLDRPAAWNLLSCREERVRNRTRPQNFIPVRSLGEARDYSSYAIPTLSDVITQPVRYTLELAVTAIDPCDGNDLAEGDEAAMVKQQYSVTYRRLDNASPGTTPDFAAGGRVTTQISMFVANMQPTDVDVTTGEWHEVRMADMRGVYWKGAPYRDKSGAMWLGDVGVLTIERDNLAVTLVGSPAEGATEQMLLEVVRNMRW